VVEEKTEVAPTIHVVHGSSRPVGRRQGLARCDEKVTLIPNIKSWSNF
jgi:hypothetical protein